MELTIEKKEIVVIPKQTIERIKNYMYKYYPDFFLSEGATVADAIDYLLTDLKA